MRKIPESESLEVEFKSDLKCYPDHDLIEEIVGMTNTEGGTLYLGVEDDGVVTGVHRKHQDSIGVTALIANSTVPPVAVRADIISEDGRNILRIEVPRSRGIISTSSGKILRRRTKLDGSPEVIPMYSYEIPSRLSELGMLDYSAQPLAGAVLEDLDPNQRVRLRRIIQTRQGGEKTLLTLSDDELDTALHFVTEVSGRYIPTVSGMLLIGKEERIAQLIPAAKSSFQVLEGTAVRMNEDSSKPLLEIFETYETYMKAWNPERETEYGMYRVPIPEFDRAAFREGLVNAFCHRDYTVLGSVRVLIDDEGLSISSPGGFIDGVNLKNLLTVEPHGKNPALADAMKRIGLAEKTGRGIDRIFEGSILYGRPWPDYTESTRTVVKLYIPRAKANLPFAKMIADEQNRRGKPLSIYNLMILSVLNQEQKCSAERIVALVHLSENKVRTALEEMSESGLIKASGKGKNTAYVIEKGLSGGNRETNQSLHSADMDSIRKFEPVVDFARTHNGIITKQDVMNLLQITPSQAYGVIKKMQEKGKLELFCGGKYARYRVICDESGDNSLFEL